MEQEIDGYKILRSLGKGGMGEVFLAFDPVLGREVALKCVRSDLKEKKSLQSRFLREAEIASQLTHPSIIPIFFINKEKLYYTMPYVEGETLRKILRDTKEQYKKDRTLHPIGSLIAVLLRIFLQVCEAISYTHSKGILHRDLKPENILIGKYGEVMIFDWGIAERIDTSQKKGNSHKVAGTVSYMAPERAFGKPSSFQTEVYALGVILYQMLTLDLPFHRGNLAAFRKTAEKEKLIDPVQLAPYREIPLEVAAIIKKCLSYEEESRFSSVDRLIAEIRKVVEGTPQWIKSSELSINNKEDWEFQENVFLSKHIAITRHVEFMEWVSLMVSKQIFPGNVRIETEFLIHNKGTGIGFLFSIPELSQRKSLEQGYCLWLGAEASSQLFRSNVLVAENEKDVIPKEKWIKVRIEKNPSYVTVFLNDNLLLSYTSKFPLSGTHIGVLHKDGEFSLKNLHVSTSSHNVMVNCLAVPDAFYAYKDYDHALLEYRKIGRSFPGREEGKEAFFRAGLTLLQKAKETKNAKEKKALFLESLDEFENLHASLGAPLQYLGKSMVYEAMKDYSEEVKCLEFALRKYPNHPLLPLFEEYILFRMHESSHRQRQAAYHLILLAVRYFPKVFSHKDTKRLLAGLKKNWEVPFFMEDSEKESLQAKIVIILAFWVRNRAILMEVPKLLLKMKDQEKKSIRNALMSLVELDFIEEAKEVFTELKEHNLNIWGFAEALENNIEKLTSLLQKAPAKLGKKQVRIIAYVLLEELLQNKLEKVKQFFTSLKPFQVAKKDLAYLDEILLWALLAEKNWKGAKNLLKRYSEKTLQSQDSPLHAPYGCFLFLTESDKKGKEHFSQMVEKTYPPTTALVGHYLMGQIKEDKGWIESAFYYEKKKLFQRLYLFYLCLEDLEKAKHFKSLYDERKTDY